MFSSLKRTLHGKTAFISLALLLAAALLFLGPSLFTKAQTPDVVATVNGEEIPRDVLVQALLDREGARILDYLIRETLVDQAARESGIVISDAVIDQEIAGIQQQFPSPEVFDQALEDAGHTLNTLRAEIRLELQLQEIVGSGISVSEEEVQEAYEMFQDQLGGVAFDEIRPQLEEHVHQTKRNTAVQTWLQQQFAAAEIGRFLR